MAKANLYHMAYYRPMQIHTPSGHNIIILGYKLAQAIMYPGII